MALKDLKPREKTKSTKDKSHDQLSKQKRIYNRLLDKRTDEIREIAKEIDYNKLFFYFEGPHIAVINFMKDKVPFHISKEIRDGHKTLQETEARHKKIKSSLGQITSGDPEHKEDYQKDAIKNAKNLYNARQKNIDLFNDSAKISSEAIYKSKQNKTEGKGLKILTPKQMIQRLPISLAQVKAGNNSECLLHEIRQIVYSLYQSQEITKKVYINIIKSIQL